MWLCHRLQDLVNSRKKRALFGLILRAFDLIQVIWTRSLKVTRHETQFLTECLWFNTSYMDTISEGHEARSSVPDGVFEGSFLQIISCNLYHWYGLLEEQGSWSRDILLCGSTRILNRSFFIHWVPFAVEEIYKAGDCSSAERLFTVKVHCFTAMESFPVLSLRRWLYMAGIDDVGV